MVDWLKEFKIKLGILNEFNVLFGLFNVNHFNLINHVVLISKQTIYTCRAKKRNKSQHPFSQITKYTYDGTEHCTNERSSRILLSQMGDFLCPGCKYKHTVNKLKYKYFHYYSY